MLVRLQINGLNWTVKSFFWIIYSITESVYFSFHSSALIYLFIDTFIYSLIYLSLNEFCKFYFYISVFACVCVCVCVCGCACLCVFLWVFVCMYVLPVVSILSVFVFPLFWKCFSKTIMVIQCYYLLKNS